MSAAATLTGEVSLAAVVVREHIEDAEGRRAETDREPRGRRRFLLHDRLAAFEKRDHVVLLAGLRFQLHEQANSGGESHGVSSIRDGMAAIAAAL